jgi:hypothetical protein
VFCISLFSFVFSSSFFDLDTVGWSCFLIEEGNITLLSTQRKLAQLIVRMLTIDQLKAIEGSLSRYKNRACNKGNIYVLMHVNPLFISRVSILFLCISSYLWAPLHVFMIGEVEPPSGSFLRSMG